MGRRSGFVEEAVYAPPPKVGAEFEGPPIGDVRPGRYMVAAIVDLGFFKDDPTRFQVVFRFWSIKNRWAWECVGADAIDVGLYKPVPKAKKKARK
jgi:hypothetical protein